MNMDIVVKNLIKKYGSELVFQDFSHVFPENSVTCIMGPSGCGKTTLLHLLMGLIPPDGGTIDGIAGKKISAVFQEDRLLENLSAKSNIRFVCPKQLPDAEIHNALVQVGLADALKKPVREFSGGMKRRVAIVRAMLAPFDIALLDEPLKGLDERTKNDTAKFLRQHLAGKTAILVTHSLQEAKQFTNNVLEIK